MSSAPSLLTREQGTSSRALRLPRLRPSTSQILVAVSVVLAFVFNLLALQQSRGTTELVAVADVQIDAGALLSEAPIRWVPISDDFEAIGSMITKPVFASESDLRFTRTVPSGAVIVRGSVARPASSDGLRIMSVPIGVDHSAGAGLIPGDRVDAISVVDGAARFIAVDLEVVGISGDGGAGFSVGAPRYVLLATSGDHALNLAQALESGSLELIRSTGADPIPEALP